MIKYDLLLCQTAFSQYFLGNGISLQDRKDYSKYAAIIDQHKVVLSSKLLDYYHQFVSQQGVLYELLFEQVFCSSFYALETSEQYHIVLDEESSYSSIDNALQWISKNQALDNPLIVCDECERCEEFVKELKPNKPVFSSEILQSSIYNKIKRNSLPFSLQVTGNEQSGAFSHWFGELFHDESKISIFDPYIISDHGIQSLVEYYIPKIESKTTVIIYSNAQNCENIDGLRERLKAIAQERRIKIEIQTAITKKDQMHGRHIFLSSAHICLDHGLDFLDAANKCVRDCYITVTERENSDLERLLHGHKYKLLFVV